MLLGRDDERAALAAALQQAAAGHGSAMLLRGPPGAGKTALLAEAQQLALRRGLKVLSCNGVRAESHLPFAALHQLLRPVAPETRPTTSELSEVLEDALNLNRHPAPEPHRVALAVLELLAHVSRQQPLLVVGDDAHWLDRPSADVFAFVGRRVTAKPVVVMLSLRDGADEQIEAAGLPLVPVGPLGEAASRALLDRVAPDLTGTVRRRLLEYAAGNPLALQELPSTWRGTGGPLSWPVLNDTLHRSFITGPAGLPPGTRMVLSAAAADARYGFAGRYSLAELAQAAAAVSGERVHASHIQPAIDARLVRLSGRQLVFAHPLMAAAVYQSLTVGDRQRIHLALARLSPGHRERRVWHQVAATMGPDDSLAAELEALAGCAAQRGAAGISAAALQRAAALVTDQSRQASLLARAHELDSESGATGRAADLSAEPSSPCPLTPQESQIAQLAAGGLSNRQIAQQLFLSHRTVGSHLYHLFPKLGITSRVQLAHVLNDSAPQGPA
ncbi:MAG TPA: BREX system ATP-binding domain-containing protein [Streptosporangiaceae bacterium]